MQNFEHSLSDIWANYKSVQDALYIRPVSEIYFIYVIYVTARF